VRETLDFAARVQGVGHKDEELRVLLEREKAAGLEPDPEVDAFVKVLTAQRGSPPLPSEHSLCSFLVTRRACACFENSSQMLSSQKMKYGVFQLLHARCPFVPRAPDRPCLRAQAETVRGGRYSIVTEFVLQILGLAYVSETLVGGSMLRGISGGQKKRVTTGEMIKEAVLLWP